MMKIRILLCTLSWQSSVSSDGVKRRRSGKPILQAFRGLETDVKSDASLPLMFPASNWCFLHQKVYCCCELLLFVIVCGRVADDKAVSLVKKRNVIFVQHHFSCVSTQNTTYNITFSVGTFLEEKFQRKNHGKTRKTAKSQECHAGPAQATQHWLTNFHADAVCARCSVFVCECYRKKRSVGIELRLNEHKKSERRHSHTFLSSENSRNRTNTGHHEGEVLRKLTSATECKTNKNQRENTTYLTGTASVSLKCVIKSVQRVAATKDPIVGTCIVLTTSFGLGRVDFIGFVAQGSLSTWKAVSCVPGLLSS